MNCHLPEEEKTTVQGSLQMNLYDLNKQLISQMPALSDKDLDNRREIITSYLKDEDNKFYMLLCKDISYYTLFQIVDNFGAPAAADEVIECAKCIGAIKSLEVNEDGAVEIWVHNVNSEEEPLVMYLFPYDTGVIECIL